jgi:hypothetical protein
LLAILLTGEYGVEGYGFATTYHKFSLRGLYPNTQIHLLFYDLHALQRGARNREEAGGQVEGRIGKALSSQDKGGHSSALFPQGFKLFIKA